MENTEAIWKQRLAKRREGIPWKVIIEAEGFRYGGTFTGHLKQARARSWIPSEETLPPAMRSDGKRVGVARKQPASSLGALMQRPTDEVSSTAGQTSLEDADTPRAIYYDAVGEFDRLPEGYAEVIQPMRPYTRRKSGH